MILMICVVNCNILHCVWVLLGFTQWVTLHLHRYQSTSQPSTGSLTTCMRLSKSSRIKQSICLLMANTNLVKTRTRLELYSIDLAQSHMVFMMSLNLSAGKSKTNVQHVLDAFKAYFKPTVSLPELVSAWQTIL